MAQALDSACFAGLLVLVLLAPLPLASNRNWSLGALALAVWSMLALSGWALMLRGRSPWAYLSAARWPLLAMGAYAALVALQMQGGPSGRLFYSADAFRTQGYLLASLVCLGAFSAVLLLVRDERRLHRLALALLCSGVLQALLAIGLLSLEARYQFMYVDVRHGSHAIGTFLNRNHLASYLYLCLSVGVGLLLAGLGTRPAPAPRAWKAWVVAALRFMVSPRMLVRLMLVVMVIALVLTRSRMGNAAFFAALSLVGLVVAVRFRNSRKLALLLVGSLLLVDVIVVGQWVGLERVLQRIEGTALERENQGPEETVEARTEPARHTPPLVMERPWFGHGGGSYFAVFPRFKSPGMGLYFDHAHNDYAEIAADTGLVGLLLLAAVALTTAHRALRLLHPRRTAAGRAAGGAALMAVLCIVLHSLVDFSLQIAAVAFTFVLILGMAWAAPQDNAQQRRRSGALPGG